MFVVRTYAILFFVWFHRQMYVTVSYWFYRTVRTLRETGHRTARYRLDDLPGFALMLSSYLDYDGAIICRLVSGCRVIGLCF